MRTVLALGLLVATTLLVPGVSADHGHGPEPDPYNAAVCHTDVWAGNIHVAPKCHELWTCLGLAEPRDKEVQVHNTYVTVYTCAPGPATGPPL